MEFTINCVEIIHIIYDCCIFCKQINNMYIAYSVAGVSVYLGSKRVLSGPEKNVQ